MKPKLLILFLNLIFQFSYSQTEINIKGTVLYEDIPLEGIEVLNLASKRTTKTDSDGHFIILTKVADTLLFISKTYEYKKLVVKKNDLYLTNRTISLIQKPEELEEIIVISKINFPKIKFDKNIASQLTIEKAAKSPKPYGVYDGTIENGISMIINMPNSRKKNHQIGFKELVKNNYNDIFFIETLKLKPEEVALFLEFCDADSKSKYVIKNSNPLKLLDFLLAKNVEFKKLPAAEY
jgi:hypothetical protein